MQLRILARHWILFFVILGTASFANRTSWAGSTTSAVSDPALQKTIERGYELERSRQWLHAIEHYEKFEKDWPGVEEAIYGLRRSKIHYGIEKRYSDSSFLKQMLTLSRRDSMGRLDEALQKIQTYYVDTVSATNFVAHGTESLYLALANQKFLQYNLPDRSPEEMKTIRTLLKEKYWNKPLASKQGAYETVSQVCDLASRELGLPASAVVMEYIFGGCNALDDYSSYLTPTRLNDLYGNIDGQFVGLGIEMKAESGKGLLLMNVLPDSPAAEGGLLAGEHIVKIDGTNCVAMTTDEAANMLQGRDGTQVTLEISGQHADTRRSRFTRRAVNVKSIPIARMVDTANGIAYLQLNGFQKNTTQELDAALSQLQRDGMRALIWDVRGNPGGLLVTAAEVLDRFIADGVLVSTRGRTPDQNQQYVAHRPGTWDMPLVLLTDGDSASASEIVAGAIRDHRRGTIVGRKTYGKWSVQTILSVRDSAGLRLTTAKFYSPHGHTFGKVGIQPDVVSPEPNKYRTFFRGPTDLNVEDDSDLQTAMKILRTQMAGRRSAAG